MNRVVITPEKVSRLKEEIEKYRNKPGPLMPVLHEAQSIFGCIPIEVQKIISDELGVSVSKIGGVVSFYSQFVVEPKGEHIIAVCMGTACYVRGAQSIVDKISSELGIAVEQTSEDGKYTLETTRCIGACGLAPVMTIDDEVYGGLTVADATKALRGEQDDK